MLRTIDQTIKWAHLYTALLTNEIEIGKIAVEFESRAIWSLGTPAFLLDL
jgi:hypothetical protein